MSDRRQRLEEMRDLLTTALREAEPSVMAQISGQLRQVLKDLDELPGSEEGNARDRWAKRIAAADAGTSATGAG